MILLILKTGGSWKQMEKVTDISLLCFWTTSALCKFNSPTVCAPLKWLFLLCLQPSKSPTCFWAFCYMDSRVQTFKVLFLPSPHHWIPDKSFRKNNLRNRSFWAACDLTLIQLFLKRVFQWGLWQFCEHYLASNSIKKYFITVILKYMLGSSFLRCWT